MADGAAPQDPAPGESGLDLGIEGITDARHIGSGGAADVYKAEQPRLGRTVAVKVLRANTSAENRSRFEREAQTLGRLSNHPGIVTLHEAGLTAIGQPFLMMEFCETGTLADRTAREGAIGWQEACRIVADISEVVDEAHASGVLHRDLKPANVLIDNRGKHLVADFGVAALSDTGNFSAAADFTPGYAPPETLRGEPATPAGDVYSLGATAHALITGRVPFEATDSESNNVLAWIRRIETEPPGNLRPLGVPDAVASVVEAAMSKDPSRRPSAQDFTAQLSAAAEGRPIPGIATTNAPPMPPGGDPATTAVAGVLPQKPTTGQPPMPGVPPVPPVGPTTGGDPVTGDQPAVSADLSGHTTAVPQLLPQKPTSMEVPGRDSQPVPPIPGQPNTGDQPPLPPGPTTGPVPGAPSTAPPPNPTPAGPTPSTGPVPPMPLGPQTAEIPSGPVTGEVPGGAVTGPATGPTTGSVPAVPTPTGPVADFGAPPVGPTTGPTPLAEHGQPSVPSQPVPSQPVPSQPVPAQPGVGPIPGDPITGEVPAAPAAAPETGPVPFTQPDTGAVPVASQPATTNVPPSLPVDPGPVHQPPAGDEGGSRKGLLIAGGVLGVAALGLGGLLVASLGGGDDETASTTTAPATTTTTAPTTTASTTTTTASTTTTTLPAVTGPVAGEVSDASIVLTGAVPDQDTVDAIVEAAATVYGEDQITNELEIDGSVEVVELTLNGTMSNIENKLNLVNALDELDNVEVIDDDLVFATTTTQATPAPTRRTTTRPPAPTTTTTRPPLGTGDTNPQLG